MERIGEPPRRSGDFEQFSPQERGEDAPVEPKQAQEIHDARGLAVALRYDPLLERSPRVVAKGDGELAHLILAVAESHGVPVREDRELAALLSGVEVGTVVPAVLFPILAEVIAFVYRLDESLETP